MLDNPLNGSTRSYYSNVLYTKYIIPKYIVFTFNLEFHTVITSAKTYANPGCNTPVIRAPMQPNAIKYHSEEFNDKIFVNDGM